MPCLLSFWVLRWTRTPRSGLTYAPVLRSWTGVPRAWTRREAGTRELVIVGTTYTVVYRIVGDVIEIAAVWHGRQSRKRR